jgi:REP element-mobilizing transposase RayT
VRDLLLGPVEIRPGIFAPTGRNEIGQGDALVNEAQAFSSPEGAKPMPQSLAQILVHLVFSTKNREPFLSETIRDELHAYIGGIVENQGGTLLKAGSVSDHIHLLIAHPRVCSPSDLVQEIKISSSKWLKTKSAEFARFHWQSGYGMFSISPIHRGALEQYIATQAEHHRKVSFQEEYRRLLEKYGVSSDERYVWD